MSTTASRIPTKYTTPKSPKHIRTTVKIDPNHSKPFSYDTPTPGLKAIQPYKIDHSDDILKTFLSRMRAPPGHTPHPGLRSQNTCQVRKLLFVID